MAAIDPPIEKFVNGPFTPSTTVPVVTVKDDKFQTTFDRSTIHDSEVRNVVTLRINDLKKINYYFTYTVNVTVNCYTSNDVTQTPQQVSFPLTVEYNPAAGTKYHGIDTYTNFPSGVYKMEVLVTSASSNQGTVNPDLIQLGASITINRKYTFQPTSPVLPTTSMAAASLNSSHSPYLNLTWTPILGAEEYDVEWCTVDNGSDYFGLVAAMDPTNASGTSAYNMTRESDFIAKLGDIFQNNATRITTSKNTYSIPLIYKDEYVFVRVRQVQYDVSGIRLLGDWDYKLNSASPQHANNVYNFWWSTWSENGLNWQYSSAFAEEGKRKGIINYFDGTLRNRQTVTINNSDDVVIAQENVYDVFGRSTASILPAPYKEDASTPAYLHFVGSFNLNSNGQPYNFDNIKGTTAPLTCEVNPDPLNSTVSRGASNYYSPNSTVLTDNAYNHTYKNFVPDAEGYPIAVTQYTPDNTGRIRIQGGVGKAFQPNAQATKYYYGKPEQWELDQLFGNDVGDASHYLKNMVIDPNNQISVSYINASGKTIATALTGPPPTSEAGLPSYNSNKQTQTVNILTPDKFVYQPSDLKLTATSTYLASVTGPVTLKYDVQQLINTQTCNGFSICSHCYYNFTLSVKDDCGNDVIPPATIPTTIGAEDHVNCTPGDDQMQQLNLTFSKIGEYHITMELELSKNTMEKYVDNFISQGQLYGCVKKDFSFIQPYLDAIDFSGCLSDCKTSLKILGDEPTFSQMFTDELLKLGVPSASLAADNSGHDYPTWLHNKYGSLLQIANTITGSCNFAPCEKYETAMLADVSPGGQYALFDNNGVALEPDINVLYKTTGNSSTPNWRVEFPVADPGSSTYQSELITLPDGTITSPYDANFTLPMLVTYWKSEWAAKFLKYHPEICKLNFCNNNSIYEDWDERVKQLVLTNGDIATKIPGATGAQYNVGDAKWLLQYDTFFNSATIDPQYKIDMGNDLDLYTSRILGYASVTTKSVTQFVDYSLYCADNRSTASTNTAPNSSSDNWDNCSVDAGCRVPDLQWAQYKDIYFQLKQQYYQKLLNATPCTAGTNCPIGVVTSSPGACATIDQFVVRPYSAADGPQTTSCGSDQQLVTLSYLPGSVPSALTIQLYYPPNVTATVLASSLNFSAGDKLQMFCIPKGIDPSDVKVQSVTCANGTSSTAGVPPTYYISVDDAYQYYDLCSYSDNQGNMYVPVNVNHYLTTVYLVDANGNSTTNLSGHPIDVVLNYNVSDPLGYYTTYTNPITFRILPNNSQSAFSYPHVTFNYYYNQYTYDYCGDIDEELNCISSTGGTIAYGYSASFLCYGTSQPSPGGSSSSCPAAYAYKISRFDSPVSASGNSMPSDPATAQTQQGALIANQVATSCDANAQAWIDALTPGLNALPDPAGATAQLRAALIDVCNRGGDMDHINGASTVAPANVSTTPGVANSFSDAIKAVLGTTIFNANLNPWLISDPYPHEVRAQQTVTTVSNSSPELCAKLAQIKQDYINSGSGASLFTYLQNQYGSAMNITSAELDALYKSCEQCRYLVNGTITLPVFMDPNSKGCVLKTTYNTDKATMFTLFAEGSGIVNSPNYQTILSNYMNQLYGFTLAYSDYQSFENDNSKTVLCNTPPFTTSPIDQYSCMKALIGTAVVNGERDYDSYIADQKNTFRSSYINTCTSIKPSAVLTAESQLNHFTLYYYDQADNLVRTVPPEGVTLLQGADLTQVGIARQASLAPCSFTGNPYVNNKPLALTILGNILDYSAPSAIESWVYNDGTYTTHVAEVTTAKNYYYQFTILGNTIGFDIYPLTESSSPAGTTLFSNINISSRHYRVTVPANTLTLWTHVVIQKSNGIVKGAGLPEIWINGVQMTVTETNTPLGSFAITATSGGMQYTDDISGLKHLRFYSRKLPQQEIIDNANNNCFMPDNFDNSWYRFNVPNLGGPTTIAGTTDETRGTPIYPKHSLQTSYVYNSTNQVIQQWSPDGGNNRFWYDILSRLIASQNDKQQPANNYSYTNYDQLSRIVEVGQKTTGQVMPYIDIIRLDNTHQIVPDYLSDTYKTPFLGNLTNTQITHTYYDDVVAHTSSNGIATVPTQNNLRKRVAASTYTENQGDAVTQATYYDYDLDGNVKTLYQQVNGLYNQQTGAGLKRIDYEYDLVSGKTNFVRYQDGQPDKFYYKYDYDEDNRLTEAWSGTDAIVDVTTGSKLLWGNARMDAHYFYYMHGPLARLELGHIKHKVQGIDYAYTLQGWLKGANGATLDYDMGGDGPNKIPKDAYAYSLGYYTNDYKSIGGSTANAFVMQYQAQTGDITGQSLYNGNISNTTLALAGLNNGAAVGYTYHYDQLNRLLKMRQHQGIGTTGWNSGSMSSEYSEDFTYDANGNITGLVRNGNNATGLAMDNLTYNYTRDAVTGKLLNNNRLHSITDQIKTNNYTTDLKDQSNASNYQYDAIGNLVYDDNGNLTGNSGKQGIEWTVYGKIRSINKGDNTSIAYQYNATGQRVNKTASGITTAYVRDAHGNAMALYDMPATGGDITWREQTLYGSERLGTWTPASDLNLNPTTVTANTTTTWNTLGNRSYELNNHLGNVLSTVTDRRVQGTSSDGVDIDTYTPDVASAQDYYAFGMQQPGRMYKANMASYRYGFNGKENDNEVKGEGDQQDYGMRIYDPRVGVFLSTDPLSRKFPWYTPYQFAGGNPVKYVDLDGEEPAPKSIHYGENVIIGIVNTASLNNGYVARGNVVIHNNNWLGEDGDLESGLDFINSLKQDMRPTTKLMNVVLVTHGSFIIRTSATGVKTTSTFFQMIPGDNSENSALSALDIAIYRDPETRNKLTTEKIKNIENLKSIFEEIGDGGNFVISACDAGADVNLGLELQKLSGNRINIYLTSDFVHISGAARQIDPTTGKDIGPAFWHGISELVDPRINNNNTNNDYKEGFTLFPAGGGAPTKLNKNIVLDPNGNAPVKKTDPVIINKPTNH